MHNNTLDISSWDHPFMTSIDEQNKDLFKFDDNVFDKIFDLSTENNHQQTESSKIKENKDQILNNIFSHRLNRTFYNDFIDKRNNYAKSFTKLIGYITSIEEDYFTANLFEEDIDGFYEEGEFFNEDIDKYDKDLFKVGAVFYWTFGHFLQNGQIKKMSEIRFQRLPSLSSGETDRIYDESKELNNNLDWD